MANKKKESTLKSLFEYVYNFTNDRLSIRVVGFTEKVDKEAKLYRCIVTVEIADLTKGLDKVVPIKQDLHFTIPADRDELVSVDGKYRVQVMSAKFYPAFEVSEALIKLPPFWFWIKKDYMSWSWRELSHTSIKSVCKHFSLLEKYYPEVKPDDVEDLSEEALEAINTIELDHNTLFKIELVTSGAKKFTNKHLTKELLDFALETYRNPENAALYSEKTPCDYQYMGALDGLFYDVREQKHMLRNRMLYDYNTTKKIKETLLQNIINRYFKFQTDNFRDIQTPKESNAMSMMSQAKTLFFYAKEKNEDTSEMVLQKQQVYNDYFVGVLDVVKTTEGPLTSKNNQLTMDTKLEDDEIKIKVLTKEFKEIEVNFEEYSRGGVLLYDYVDYEKRKIVPQDGKYTYFKYGKYFTTSNTGDFKYIRTEKNRLCPATSLLPFMNKMIPTRTALASHFLEQSIPVVGSKPPAVVTKANKEMFEQSPYNTRCDIEGEVVATDLGFVKVQPKSGGRPIVFGDGFTYKNTTDHTTNEFKVRVKPGDKVKPGDTLISINSFVDDEFSTSVPLYTMFGAYLGYNQEDGIILTESAAKKFTLVQTVDVDHIPQYKASFFPPEDDIRYNQFNIINVGQKVTAGDTLFQYYEYPDERDAQVRLATSLLIGSAAQNRQVRRLRTFKAPLDIEDGTVVDVRVILNYETIKSQNGPNIKQPRMLGHNNMIDKSVLEFVNYYQKEEEAYKRRYKAISNHTPEQYVFRDPLSTFRVVITIKYADTMAMHRLGGKITNYYGSKGVNTYIIPDTEAPHDEFGNTIECILSSVALYSRNNPSQITECKLGLCCLEGWKFIQKNGINSAKTKEFLDAFYPEARYDLKQVQSDGEKYGYIRALAGPFDRYYSMGKIKQLLNLLGLGTGDAKIFFPKFNRWSQTKQTVGLVSMIRLHFLQEKKAKVSADINMDTDEDNISYMGVQKEEGQKMGALEVWALMAHGQQGILQDIQKTYDKKASKFDAALLALGLQLNHGPDKK